MNKPQQGVNDPYFGALALEALRKRFERKMTGVCYVCGCTEDTACDPPCSWMDEVARTLCDDPLCEQLDEAVR